ncbi:MAG: diguanylate cyclase [Burkholderiales bacterium]
MEILERIEAQIGASKLPLFAVTVAAVPCPDTPVILTLHWHGFVRERLVEIDEADAITYIPIPSSALQVNDRWTDILDLDRAAMEAGWELGAWDVARAERPSCTRPGADSSEAVDCLKAFGAFPFGVNGQQPVLADAPDADDLLDLAGRRGYLMWLFRPVRGGIWGEVANDATLLPGGTREPPCPHTPIRPNLKSANRTVYRFGLPGSPRSLGGPS